MILGHQSRQRGKRNCLPSTEQEKFFIFDNGVIRLLNKTMRVPILKEKVHAVLKEPQTFTSRSYKSKRAFMYSSPWAALNSFDPSKILLEAPFQLKTSVPQVVPNSQGL